MSSFSDKLAMFQNNLNKINVGNKNNEGINKNKLNENFHMLKLDEKVKTKEKEENKEIKIIPNSKKKNNIPINDIIINNTDDKKQIEKKDLENKTDNKSKINNSNNLKNRLNIFESKLKNEEIKDNT